MEIDDDNGWLAEAERRPSPHCDERPAGVEPELVVIHCISLPPGEFGGRWIDDLFLGRLDPDAHPYFADIARRRVSAHALIRRDGSVVQYVPFDKRAWHAGESRWRGRPACNDFSIGVELEGTDDSPYEPAQYEALASLIGALRDRYPTIGTDGLAGHCDIAPGRKTDPGPAFDWQHLTHLLAVGRRAP